MNKVVPIKPPRAHKHSAMETKLLTREEIENWKQPPFQRPIRINSKVMEYVEQLKQNGGMISGVITLGRLPDDPAIYKVDGAHRAEAAKLSELPEFIADVRTMDFDSMQEMAQEFAELNGKLVAMRPDDILRAVAQGNAHLQQLRKVCDFVGYDNVRRGTSATSLIGMASLLRCWFGSDGEMPGNCTGTPAPTLVDVLDDMEVQNLTGFLNAAHAAWRADPEYYRLWSTLNLTMCMWLYRQMVLKQQADRKKHITLNLQDFGKCLMALTAAPDYLDWLRGHTMNERDRSPCYARVREVFARRLTELYGGKRPFFPQPEWMGKTGKR